MSSLGFFSKNQQDIFLSNEYQSLAIYQALDTTYSISSSVT